jgi:hypothetical protein
VSVITCLTHIESIFDSVSCVHQHIFSYCRRWYAMLHSSKICNFLLMDDILYISQKKRPMVLSLAILGTMLGNRLFQATCSESVLLKTDGQCFQNVGALYPASTIHYKAVLAPCSVQAGMACHGCFVEGKRSSDAIFFIMPHHTLTFDRFLCRSMIS